MTVHWEEAADSDLAEVKEHKSSLESSLCLRWLLRGHAAFSPRPLMEDRRDVQADSTSLQLCGSCEMSTFKSRPPKTSDLGWAGLAGWLLLLLLNYCCQIETWSEQERMMMREAWKRQFERFEQKMRWKCWRISDNCK